MSNFDKSLELRFTKRHAGSIKTFDESSAWRIYAK